MPEVTINESESTYRIGAVARQTGIPVATLRIWERRYGVVKPARTGAAGRRYSRAQIHRLALVKSLVDRGDAIGQVAALTDDALRDRIAAAEALRPPPPPLVRGHAPRIAVCGELLPLQLAGAPGALAGLEVTGTHRTVAELEAALALAGADVLLLEYATLQRESVPELRRLLAAAGARHAVVVYGFAAQDTLALLPAALFTTLQSPQSLPLLARELGRVTRTAPAAPLHLADAEPPAPRFAARDLVRASGASTTVKCECPRHLANLILQLSRFETYSAQCENRNDADAYLHESLRRATGHARAMMEEALERVLEAEATAGMTVRQ